jgi:hypothetical protein
VVKVSQLATIFEASLAKQAYTSIQVLDYKSLIDSDMKSRKWKDLKENDVALNNTESVLFKDSLWVY